MNTEMTSEEPFRANPFEPGAEDPPAPREGFKMIRNFELPMVARKSSYPFADLRLHDAIIFDTARELKNALQAARTYKKQSPRFKVSVDAASPRVSTPACSR